MTFAPGSAPHGGRQLGYDVGLAIVGNRMHRIDPQSIEMIIAQPHERVVAEEAAHFVAATFVEINGVAPRRCISMRQVVAEA